MAKINSPGCHHWSRREMLAACGGLVASLAVPRSARASLGTLKQPVSLGMIADLHHDVMHDGPQRLNAFIQAMQAAKPAAIIQLGDFAYPNAKNQPVTDAFHKAHSRTFHVLGNHEIDDGHTFDQVAKLWDMSGRYYSDNINGLNLIVLDGNEKPADHKGGYPSHIGSQQLAWLEQELKRLPGPILVICHQPLAGPWCIDNSQQVQKVLNAAADKVVLTVNGHSHIDYVVRVGQIVNLHINSASYQWVGGSHRHKSYPDKVHARFPWVEYTCPYKEALFATLTLDPRSGRIHITGRDSQWVGKSPAQLGLDMHPDLTDGEQICPRIRSRQLARAVK